MKVLAKVALVMLVFAGMATDSIAQKFGYLNSAAVLQSMPEVQQAEANLETLRQQLQNKGEQMLKDFQQRYLELQRKQEQGEISPKDLEVEAQSLREEENKIKQFEEDMQRQVFEKQETLLEPILEQVNTAIQEVAKEEGFAYIFDASPGNSIILYADESTNVEDQVRAKLGL